MRSLDVIGGFARLVRENGQGRHIFTKMWLALLALPSGTCGAETCEGTAVEVGSVGFPKLRGTSRTGRDAAGRDGGNQALRLTCLTR